MNISPFLIQSINPPNPPADITDRGFTGHKHNDDIGLIYMNARYYLPSVGRFASADTIVPNAADPQSYNRYSYTRNNPVNLVDPTGHYYVYDDGDVFCWPGCPIPLSPEDEWIEDADGLYEDIMDDYTSDAVDLLNDGLVGGVEFVEQELVRGYFELAGINPDEVEWFDSTGKAFDLIGASLDFINLILRVSAIIQANNDNPGMYTTQQLDYFFTRAIATFEAALLMTGVSIANPMIGVADFVNSAANIGLRADGHDRQDADEWIGMQVAHTIFYDVMRVNENGEIVYRYEENRSYWPFGGYRALNDLLVNKD